MGEQPRPVWWDDVQEQIRLAWITKETPHGAYVLEMHEDDLFEYLYVLGTSDTFAATVRAMVRAGIVGPYRIAGLPVRVSAEAVRGMPWVVRVREEKDREIREQVRVLGLAAKELVKAREAWAMAAEKLAGGKSPEASTRLMLAAEKRCRGLLRRLPALIERECAARKKERDEDAEDKKRQVRMSARETLLVADFWRKAGYDA